MVATMTISRLHGGKVHTNTKMRDESYRQDVQCAPGREECDA